MKKVIIPTIIFAVLSFFLPGISIGEPASLPETELFNEGISLYKKGSYPQAIDTLSKVIELAPDHLDAFRIRGSSFMKQNKFKMAIKDFEKAVGLAPDQNGVYSDLGTAWYYEKNYEKALDNYDREIEKGHQNHLVFFNRALCLEKLGKIDRALEDINTSLAIKSDFYWAYSYKGNLLVHKKEYEAAVKAYQAAIDIDADDPYAKEKLAQVRTQIKKSGNMNEESAEWSIQSGAFLVQKNAVRLKKKLTEKGFNTRVITLKDHKGRQWYIVRSGRYPDEETAKKAMPKFTESGYNPVVRPADTW